MDYKNKIVEVIKKRGITTKKAASEMGITINTFYNKMSDKSPKDFFNKKNYEKISTLK